MTAAVKRTHDDAFYQDLVIFEVEGTVFRVPKEGFDLPRAMFHDMFSLPPGEGQTAEGQTDDHPIVIPGVSKREFRNLLRVMHPHMTDGGPPTKKEDLLDALRPASMWMLHKVKESAVERLTPFFPKSCESDALSVQSLLDKVKLGQEYNVDKWIHECCVDLAHSQQPVDYEAFLAAGVQPKIIANIAKTREKVFLSYTNLVARTKDGFRSETEKARCTNCQEVGWGKTFPFTEMCRRHIHDLRLEHHGPPLDDEFNCYGCNLPLSLLDVERDIGCNLLKAFKSSEMGLGESD